MTQSTWQFIIYIAILVLSVGITYGALNVKVSILEDSAVISSKDHDLITSIQTKLDFILDDLREIKLDLKAIKER